MAYRFKLDEGFAEGLRRIALEQIEIARIGLEAPPDPSIAIHETRKALKRARALLGLARPGLDRAVARAENARLRDAGRMLAGERDRAVLVETVAHLTAGEARRRGKAWAALRRAGEAWPLANDPVAEADRRREAARLLDEAARSLARLELSPDSLEPIAEGLEAAYRDCRRTFAAAMAEPVDEAIHDTRKAIQRHWRHMLLLSRAWPGTMRARANAARDLSQLLGEDHDLAVLCARIEAGELPGLTAKAAAPVVSASRARQQQIRAAVVPRADRLLLERPARFRKRVVGYWAAARAIGEG